jgi:hypothetical protein
MAIKDRMFEAVQRKDRPYMKKELLAGQNNIMVQFLGEPLKRPDLDVHETLSTSGVSILSVTLALSGRSVC